MNGTTNTKPFANFAPGDTRDLLADVHRWARANGWNWHEAWGWVNALYASEASLNVEWEHGQLTVRHGTDGVFGRPTKYDADSVRQAVDYLVALEILPARFARAYQAGVKAGFDSALELSAATAAEVTE